jgi:hypothetical protein
MMRKKGKSAWRAKRLFSSVSSRHDISDFLIAADPIVA